MGPAKAHEVAATHSVTVGAATASCSACHFGKSSHATGICFLDHMVDQVRNSRPDPTAVTRTLSVRGGRRFETFSRMSWRDLMVTRLVFSGCK